MAVAASFHFPSVPIVRNPLPCALGRGTLMQHQTTARSQYELCSSIFVGSVMICKFAATYRTRRRRIKPSCWHCLPRCLVRTFAAQDVELRELLLHASNGGSMPSSQKTSDVREGPVAIVDHSSFANINDVRVLHAHFDVTVDFNSKVISGTTTLTVISMNDHASSLVLDTRDLTIHNIQANGSDVPFSVRQVHQALGSALEVSLPDPLPQGCKTRVVVAFSTSPQSSAVQFLEPAQTAGHKHPYLFTQCQAIHARSLFPLQDTPAAKMTYTAHVTVPVALRALMSAVPQNNGDPINVHDGTHTFAFEQMVPIPSYLIALVVGDLECRRIGPRSRLWSEPCMVEAGAWEFAETEEYLKTAEDIAGPYVWEVYDILLLPPSFPYGGMENPCLTFVTPTLLAGDRSLTNVVAHEIAHSWTGNLVTCQTWEHFWLNEGFDVYLERKILGRLTGDPIFDLHKDMGKVTLWKTVLQIGPTHNFTKLVPDLSGGIDPDDAFSSIPYEKGFYFVCYLEALAGGAVIFEPWFKSFWLGGKARAVTSYDLQSAYTTAFPQAAAQVDWDGWFFSPGYPTVADVGSVQIQYASALGRASLALARSWRLAADDDDFGGPEDIVGWSIPQKLLFLDELSKDPLSLTKCRRLGQIYKLPQSRNCEIRLRWYEIAIAAKNVEELAGAATFAAEQGRMKYVRPLYKALYNSEQGRQLALDTFEQHRSSYHPICQKMVEADLGLRVSHQ